MSEAGVARRTAVSAELENNEMQSVFLNQMDRLLLPAYLLTGSHEQAAQCLLEAWDDCMSVPSIAENKAFHVAKGAVIQAAIRKIVANSAREVDGDVPEYSMNLEDIGDRRDQDESRRGAATFLSALLDLDLYQRAALVLRIYEGYSSAEAASLLRVPRQTLENCWQQALIALQENFRTTNIAESGIIGGQILHKTDLEHHVR
jgi:DNA-directed RNA polymerase specialized sigma24 family protein